MSTLTITAETTVLSDTILGGSRDRGLERLQALKAKWARERFWEPTSTARLDVVDTTTRF